MEDRTHSPLSHYTFSLALQVLPGKTKGLTCTYYHPQQRPHNCRHSLLTVPSSMRYFCIFRYILQPSYFRGSPGLTWQSHPPQSQSTSYGGRQASLGLSPGPFYFLTASLGCMSYHPIARGHAAVSRAKRPSIPYHMGEGTTSGWPLRGIGFHLMSCHPIAETMQPL